jgi:two-component system chemotaxis response regulator CheB
VTIDVVIVEDSVGARDDLRRVLEADGDVRVVGQASRAQDAIGLVASLRPDVVTLDVQRSDGRGIEIIEQIMAFNPTPILVLSSAVTGPESSAAVEALVAGAVDALPKPAVWQAADGQRLRERVRIVRGVTVVRHVRGRLRRDRKGTVDPELSTATGVVGIASSTGGPAALAVVLAGLVGLRAAVVVVQHIHPDFVDGFARWMSRVSAVPVEVASHGSRIEPGMAYIAPGGAHLIIQANGTLGLAREPEMLHRPSADVLFRSIAERPRGKKVGVVLTGLGDDGAAGLLELKKRGGTTIAQDEETSAVFGMPAAAQRLGAVQQLLPLEQIAAAILRAS